MVKVMIDGLELETERPVGTEPYNPALGNNCWNSVEDILPPEKHEVLYFATFQNDMSKEIMTGHREGNAWTHCCMFYATVTLNDNVKVTHWMELPEYPRR